MLRGAAVRDRAGLKGRIVGWQLPQLEIAWHDRGLAPRSEKLLSDNPRLQRQIEVLSLDAGWVPLSTFATPSGVPAAPAPVSLQLRALIHEAGKEHSPFKRKDKLGPGPRRGTNTKADSWDCKCDGYRCKCKGIGKNRGRDKTVEIDSGYKRMYNKEYKRFVRTKR